jgi:hypothetical protein
VAEGVAEATLFVLAVDLLHLPGKPAGVAAYSPVESDNL